MLYRHANRRIVDLVTEFSQIFQIIVGYAQGRCDAGHDTSWVQQRRQLSIVVVDVVLAVFDEEHAVWVLNVARPDYLAAFKHHSGIFSSILAIFILILQTPLLLLLLVQLLLVMLIGVVHRLVLHIVALIGVEAGVGFFVTNKVLLVDEYAAVFIDVSQPLVAHLWRERLHVLLSDILEQRIQRYIRLLHNVL